MSIIKKILAWGGSIFGVLIVIGVVASPSQPVAKILTSPESHPTVLGTQATATPVATATPTATPRPTVTTVATPVSTPVAATPVKPPAHTPVKAATPAPVVVNKCDPNYSGCVPIASDVDCAGGSGNGPAYVQGPIRVIGSDIYRLDSDHDGIACE